MERVFLHYLERFVTAERKNTKHAFWHYLKQFGILENFLKHKVSKAYTLSMFENIWNFRHNFENKVSKAFVLILSWKNLELIGQFSKQGR